MYRYMSLTNKAENTRKEFVGKADSGKKIALILIHIALWAIFLSLPALFNPARHGQGISRFVLDMEEPPRWVNRLFLIIVFYFNSYIAIPQLYFQRRYLLLTILIMITFGIFYCLNYLLAPPEIKASPMFNPLGNSFNLFMLIIVYTCSFIICLYKQFERIKEDRLSTRMSFLIAQIHPHFLFNTLNNIYSLSIAKSDKVPDAIVKLSGMMRYSVSEGNKSLVSFASEAAYIRNYVDLQKLRLTDEVIISLDISGENNDVKIPPFLMIPFVENAFKHGTNGENSSVITIIASATRDELTMDISNTIVPIRLDREAGIGLGIETTRQRLKLLYPGKYTLATNNDSGSFTVSLKIQFR